MLDQRRLLAWPWCFGLCWRLSHHHRRRELWSAALYWMPFGISSSTSFTLFLGGVNTPLCVATSCIPFARTSLHFPSLDSSSRLQVMAHMFLPVSFDAIRPSLPPISLPVLIRLVLPHREHTLQGPLRSPYSNISSDVNFPVKVHRSFPSSFEDGPSHVFFVFLPCGFLINWFDTSCNFDIQDAYTYVNSREVVDFIFRFLTLFVSFAFVPRTAAGTPALPSLPRPSYQIGLSCMLSVHRNGGERLDTTRGTLITNRKTNTLFNGLCFRNSSGHISASQEANTRLDATDTTEAPEHHLSTTESTRKNSVITHWTRRDQFKGSHRRAGHVRNLFSHTSFFIRCDSKEPSRVFYLG